MGTLSIPTVGEANTTADPKVKTALETLNNLLDGSNLVLATKLAGEIPNTKLSQSKLTWYTPKVIATEQSRENVAFGTLTTADEIKEVVVPENGVMIVMYKAIVKASVSEAGRVAIFLGANQLKKPSSGAPEVAEASTASGTSFQQMVAGAAGLKSLGAGTSFVTTGETMGLEAGTAIGLTPIRAAAATYNVSVQYRATSGNVTAKERTLWVAVLG